MPRLQALWKILTLCCREADPLISTQMDRGLGAAEALGLEAHLLVCSSCRRKRKHSNFLRAAMQRFARETKPAGPPLPVEDRERIARSIEGS